MLSLKCFEVTTQSRVMKTLSVGSLKLLDVGLIKSKGALVEIQENSKKKAKPLNVSLLR